MQTRRQKTAVPAPPKEPVTVTAACLGKRTESTDSSSRDGSYPESGDSVSRSSARRRSLVIESQQRHWSNEDGKEAGKRNGAHLEGRVRSRSRGHASQAKGGTACDGECRTGAEAKLRYGRRGERRASPNYDMGPPHAHLDQRECNRCLTSDAPEYYCNAVLVLGWTASEVEQCLQELNDGTSYRTTPLTIVPFDLALRWGLLVVRLLDENEDISVPPRFCGHSRTARRRERRRASKAKSKAIEAYSSLPADGHEIEALQNGGAGMEMQECQALVRRIRLSTEESWHQEVMMVQGAAQQRGNRSFHQWW